MSDHRESSPCRGFFTLPRGPRTDSGYSPTIKSTGAQVSQHERWRTAGRLQRDCHRKFRRSLHREPRRYLLSSPPSSQCSSSRWRCQAVIVRHRTILFSPVAPKPDRLPSWSRARFPSPLVRQSPNGQSKYLWERRNGFLFFSAQWVLRMHRIAQAVTSSSIAQLQRFSRVSAIALLQR